MACTATVIPTTQTYQVSTDYAGTRRAGNTPEQQPNSQLFCRPQPNGKPQVTALQNPYPRRSEPGRCAGGGNPLMRVTNTDEHRNASRVDGGCRCRTPLPAD